MIMSKAILYIDDVSHNLQSFKLLFNDDYKVFTALNADEGLKILSKNSIQIIICDQKMPGKTGIEFFSSILLSYPKPIRILLTAYVDAQSAVEAINKAKIYQHVTKGWDEFDMRLTIENALRLYYDKNPLVNEKNKFFISHSSKDSEIVEPFIDNILCLGLNISRDDIFCSSIDEMGIRSGKNFREIIKDELQNSKAVIQIITKNYKESEVCLNEMGAAWVLNSTVVAFILEPITFNNVGFIHSVNQLLKLNDKNKLLKFIEDYKGELFDTNINMVALNRHIDNFLKSLVIIN